MRIDEIDLYGNILISGFTGSEGQILTYNSGGAFDWGTASGGSSGPTSSYFKTSGYNYVICETVNNGVDPAADAVINGNNLQNAYNVAKTLDVGTKSATNRVVVLLMPGDYDLSSSQLVLDTSFIDIVGISTNPYNTKLRSSTQIYVIQYSSVVDSALKNLFLYNASAGGTYIFDDDGGLGDGSYLRWENLFLVGYLFSDGSTFGFNNIYGEFRNIKFLDGAYYFLAGSNIDGIFENIEAPGTNYSGLITAGQVTPGSTLTGTFSNINFNVVLGSPCLSSNGVLSGYYENINILDGAGGAFQGYSINGTFKNIRIGGVGVSAFIANSYSDLSGTYENIQITDATTAFYSVETSIYGTYKNIEIGNLTNTSFSGSTVSGVFEDIKVGGTSSQYFFYGSLSGQFKNIEVGNVSGSAFSAALSSIDGNYENITIGNVTNNAFKATDMISGSFKNIKIGDITNNNAFYVDSGSGQILGTFDEIQIGNIASTTGYFFTSGAIMSGTFSNIEIGDASEWATGGIQMFCLNSSGSITGSYKNIKVSNTSFLFYPVGQDLNGTFENIEFGSSSYAFYTNAGSILGTYSNIKSFSQQERVFSSAIDLIGTFENIEISNSIVTSVFKADNSLSGTFKNIKLGDLSLIVDHVFYSGVTDLIGTFENIEVGNGNSTYDVFRSPSANIIGTFSNITVGGDWSYVFNANNGSGGFSGYFKDIYISALTSDYAFYGASVSSTSTIDNLWCDNRFFAGLGGKLLNSSIFGFNVGSGWALDIQADGTIIENCKIIGRVDGPPDYGIYSTTGAKSNVQILYTALYKDVQVASITVITPNYNIIEITT